MNDESFDRYEKYLFFQIIIFTVFHLIKVVSALNQHNPLLNFFYFNIQDVTLGKYGWSLYASKQQRYTKCIILLTVVVNVN